MLSSTIYANGLVGHREVVDRLSDLIQTKRLPHGLLFSGPSGVGKFFVAQWVAAAFLCPEAGCGVCPTCKKALSFQHPDIHRVEAEEGRRDITISQIRRLMDTVGLKPFEAGAKAVVLDEADRMNDESQNAFLKTLEEPPPDTLIILVSSVPEKLLPTIRSRCQRFRFNRLSQEDFLSLIENREELRTALPLKLAQGSPGKLSGLMKAEADQARRLFSAFISSETVPSPVKATAEMMKWAQEQAVGESKHQVRERLRMALNLGATLLRDVVILSQGAGADHLMNNDMQLELERASCYYRLSGLLYAIQQVVDASTDIAGYVDPGLALENVFRIIREMRK